MLAVFQYAFNAVSPILILGAIGYLARQMGWFTKDALKAMNRFNFRFCLSCLMFVNVYEAENSMGLVPSLLLTLFAALILLTVVGVAAANLVTKDGSRKAILVQAAFRSNYAIIGLPVVASLAGQEALGLASLFQIPCVMYYNGMSVFLLLHYAGQHSDSENPVRKVVTGILTNPLIDGLLVGTAVLLLRPLIPTGADGQMLFTISGSLPWAYQVVKYLANMSTPLALIVLGGQMDFKSIAGVRRELITGVFLRLVVAPALGFLVLFVSYGLGLVDLPRAVVALVTAVFSSPLAAASVVMAAEMNGDDQLCGQIVAWTSALGMFSLFVVISLLRATGWL